jgi:hypothetical protein
MAEKSVHCTLYKLVYKGVITVQYRSEPLGLCGLGKNYKQ